MGMEYLLEHLEDLKLFYHHAPDEAATGDTDVQGALLRGRPSRRRQLPARFEGCEVDISPRGPREGALPGGGRGKAGGSSGVEGMGEDHRRYMRLSITTAWQKLDEYYTKLGESPLFAASIILHPALGMTYLEMNWATEEQLVWVRDAKIGLSDYFERWYCGRGRTAAAGEQQIAIVESAPSLGVPRKAHEDSAFKQWVKSKTWHSGDGDGL